MSQRIAVSIHDYLPYPTASGKIEQAEIKIHAGSMTAFGEYAVIRIGDNADIFISPERLERLRTEIVRFLSERNAAVAEPMRSIVNAVSPHCPVIIEDGGSSDAK